MIIIYRYSIWINDTNKQTNKCQLKSFFRCCSFLFLFSLSKSSNKKEVPCIHRMFVWFFFNSSKFKFQLSPTQQQQHLNSVCVCDHHHYSQPEKKASISVVIFFSSIMITRGWVFSLFLCAVFFLFSHYFRFKSMLMKTMCFFYCYLNFKS